MFASPELFSTYPDLKTLSPEEISFLQDLIIESYFDNNSIIDDIGLQLVCESEIISDFPYDISVIGFSKVSGRAAVYTHIKKKSLDSLIKKVYNNLRNTNLG